MNIFKRIVKLSGTAFTKNQYYESMNMALKRINNEYTMLHYPYFVNESDSFFQAQKNLTDYCISLVGPVNKKNILEIGCGNGVQAMYINASYNPAKITGIDLNRANIDIANSEKEKASLKNVEFLVDDAQNLSQIPSESVDVLLNIESAFHYPDKSAFISEVHRVLKPGGQYLVADILSTRRKREGFMKLWGKPMGHNFWTRNRYENEFEKSELVVNHREDITQKVRKGWSMYRKWLPEIDRKLLFQSLIFRIYYLINVRVNMHLLSSRQQYYVYTGYKPHLNFR